jgi:hypothetical protein
MNPLDAANDQILRSREMSLATLTRFPLPWAAAFAICTALVLVAGCSQDKKAGDDHGHGHSHDHATVGPHGGMIIEWGDHEHHLELKFDRAQKQATVYVVDHDVKKVQPTALVTPLLKLNGVATPIPLVPTPLEGETAEKSSRYVATDDALADEKPFAGALSGKVGDTDYFRRFQEEDKKQATKPADQADHTGHDHDHKNDAHTHDAEKKDAEKKDAAKQDDHEEHGHDQDHAHEHGKPDHDHPHDDHPHDDKEHHDHGDETKPATSTDGPKGEAKPDAHGDHDHGDHDHEHAEQPAAESPKTDDQPAAEKPDDEHDHDHGHEQDHPANGSASPKTSGSEEQSLDDQRHRAEQLLYTSENLRGLAEDWERFWFMDGPDADISEIRNGSGSSR